MKIKELKNILKEINEPNEFQFDWYENQYLYWVYRKQNIRVKTLYSELEDFRKPKARFDVFINGQYIREIDYKIEAIDDFLYIKFIKANFNYTLDETDVIKLNGDLEIIG